MVVTYSSNIEKWKNELSRRVLDLVVYLSKNGGRIYDTHTESMLEDFWKRIGEAEQTGVNCKVYRTQISNMVAHCRRGLLKLIK